MEAAPSSSHSALLIHICAHARGSEGGTEGTEVHRDARGRAAAVSGKGGEVCARARVYLFCVGQGKEVGK